MRKHDFIDALAAKANISTEDAAKVNDIMENHSLIGKNSKAAAVQEIAAALNVNDDQADAISNAAYDIIGGALKDKILHPFGGRD